MSFRQEQNDDADSALAFAVRALSRRALSVSEVRARLGVQGYGATATDSSILDLIKRGYLDDAALCGVLVDKYLRQGKYSSHSVSQKLRQRGLTTETIRDGLKEWPVEEEWRQALILLQKRFAGKTAAPVRDKMLRYLLSRGFSSTAVRRAVECFTQEPTDIVEW